MKNRKFLYQFLKNLVGVSIFAALVAGISIGGGALIHYLASHLTAPPWWEVMLIFVVILSLIFAWLDTN